MPEHLCVDFSELDSGSWVEHGGGGRDWAIVAKAYSELLPDFASIESLVSALGTELTPNVGRGGQRLVKRGTLQCVVRNMRRGGFVSYLSEDLFLKSPLSNFLDLRPCREFKILLFLHELQIQVPKPVLALVRGDNLRFSYRASLVTEYLADTLNLLEELYTKSLDGSRLKQFERASYMAGVEANCALRAGIKHVDLHLGNVLLRDNEVFIIDFDKAKVITTEDYPSAKRFLEKRWEKSLYRHRQRLGRAKDTLSAAFLSGLNEAVLDENL